MSHRYRTTNDVPPLLHIRKDLGKQIKQFAPGTKDVSQVVQITDLQAVASYSWLDSVTPTIAVPGTFLSITSLKGLIRVTI
jgi:hypothetical protein